MERKERRNEKEMKRNEFKYEEPTEWGGKYQVTGTEEEKMKKEGKQVYFTLIEMKNGMICKEYHLSKYSFYSLGRGDNCLIIMDHPSISRIHAIFQLRKWDGALFLYDLNSTHGTKVNKQSLSKQSFFQLKKGDHIRFGESSRTFVVDGGPFLSLDEEQAKQSISQEEQKLRSRKNQQKMMELVKKSKELRKQDEEDSMNRKEKEEEKTEENEEDAEEANADWTETTKMHRVAELDQEDDDDDYYDRTRKTKTNTETRTYSDLLKEKEEIQSQISKLNIDLDNFKETKTEENESDSLDSYMTQLKSAEKMGDRNKITQQIDDLKTKLDKTNYLLQLAAPAINSIPLPTKASSPSPPKRCVVQQNNSALMVSTTKKEGDLPNELPPPTKKQKSEQKNKKKREMKKQTAVQAPSHPSFVEEDDFSEVPLEFYG